MDNFGPCFVVFGGIFRFSCVREHRQKKNSLCSRTKRGFSVFSTELRWRRFVHCAKALVLCSQLKGVELETNESAIRVLNCSKSDTGQTDHQTIVIVKPTGPEEEEQLTCPCADPSLGTEATFLLECGAIPPARPGLSRRAVASRLPFNGAPAEMTGVFIGIILQSKLSLAQRMPILKAGLRQMVMEATHLAMCEQSAILD